MHGPTDPVCFNVYMEQNGSETFSTFGYIKWTTAVLICNESLITLLQIVNDYSEFLLYGLMRHLCTRLTRLKRRALFILIQMCCTLWAQSCGCCFPINFSDPAMCPSSLAPWHSSQTCLFCTQKQQEENKTMWSLGFQLSSGSRCLFDAADRPGFVRYPPCQIKGQCLDSEATLLFLVVQPRERPNKSGGNVVTGEL